MEKTARGYRLSSGREFHANGLDGAGLISIGVCRQGTYLIGNGYDGLLTGATRDGEPFDPADARPGELPENWTPEEQRELAEFMIAQWTAFKDSCSSFELIDERDPTPEERALGIVKQRLYRR